MNCQTVRGTISEYLGSRMPESEFAAVRKHLADCPECASSAETISLLRDALKSAPRYTAPANLSMNLRVIASRELARQASRETWQARVADWRGSLRLWVDNMMRPFAIPFAGGLASAFVLFGMLAPTFARVYSPTADVPPGWYTGASLDTLGPFGLADDTVILDVTIDDQGRMVDYAVPGGQPGPWKDEALRRMIVNSLLFTRFTPANFFGQPTYGKVRVTLRRSQVDVRG
jgi:hypothetical protein